MREEEEKLRALMRAARGANIGVVTVPVSLLEDLVRENAVLREFADRGRQQPPAVVSGGRDGDN